MRREHLDYLICPDCHGNLKINTIEIENDSHIEEGSLKCDSCSVQFPIIHYIPRFVPIDNYADSFGYEWMTHARTQYDTEMGDSISKKRFFTETNWPREKKGEIILEAGCGSGRFTEQAASTGAMVISFDYSRAVEANFATNGMKENVLIIQADIFSMPFEKEFFDRIFCIGVLQHTPNPKKGFHCLTEKLKYGGHIVVDLYRKYGFFKQLLITKYWVRPITRHIQPEKLYRWCRTYVYFMWPLSSFLSKRFGDFGKKINWTLLVADYRGVLTLSEDKLKEMAVLDTFDMLSPMYDYPQTLTEVLKWFKEAGLSMIEVDYGFNGIYGRGKKY
ncbi:methyltransferase domain-containing protein [Methanocalculus sp. MC3]